MRGQTVEADQDGFRGGGQKPPEGGFRPVRGDGEESRPQRGYRSEGDRQKNGLPAADAYKVALPDTRSLHEGGQVEAGRSPVSERQRFDVVPERECSGTTGSCFIEESVNGPRHFRGYSTFLPHEGQNLLPGGRSAPQEQVEPPSFWPHSGQNLAPFEITAPHLGQVAPIGFPHSGQNLAGGTCLEHDGQTTRAAAAP